ncbi:MAG: hypothetical protein IJ845_11115 [Bacteroidaceae bacterium]|nr:hypothetical protein [Bacteroidaceae bacterium]
MRRVSFYTLAALLVAGAAITACTSDDFADEALAPQQGKTYTLSVNATKGADTRTLVEEEGALTASWNANDEIKVYKGDTEVGALKPTAAGATKLKGEVTDVAVGDELTLKFQSDADYTSQDGTLDYIDTHCSAAVATVEVTKIEGSDVYTSDATFENQQSITKFTFSETVSKVVISGGAKEITVKPGSATKELYVAMPGTENSTEYVFTATVSGATYFGKKGAKLDNGKFYTASVTLTAQTEYINLSADATANTYMVTSAGKYKFNATVKGNGGIDPITGTTATAISGIAGVKVLWELYGQGRAINHDGTSYDISFEDGYVYFSTPDTFTSGDAYVAVYDSEGTILWSWLIWATETPTEKVINGITIMDRNLGALNIDTDFYKIGLNYQWGRKDPFTAGTRYDKATEYVFVPEIKTAFSYINVGTVGTDVNYTIANPTTFVQPTYPNNWLSEKAFNNNLWMDDQKTIYDPCPQGWRIPSKDTMNTFAKDANLPSGGGATNYSIAKDRFEFANSGSVGYYNMSTSINRTNCYEWRTIDTEARLDYHMFARSIRPVKEGIDVTGVEVGMVIGANGKFYANKAAAEAAGTTAEAMVAYLGTAPEGGTGDATTTNGLAIALEDAASDWNAGSSNWNDGLDAITSWAESNAVAIGTWRMPTVDDFKYMFSSCGGSEYNAESSNCDYGNFNTMLAAKGGTEMKTDWNYFLNTFSSSYTYRYDFSNKKFNTHAKSFGGYPRAVLAF